jgi:hypothetical protein
MSCPASRTRLCWVQMVARYLPGVKESIELTGRRPPAAAAARCSGIGRPLCGLAHARAVHVMASCSLRRRAAPSHRAVCVAPASLMLTRGTSPLGLAGKGPQIQATEAHYRRKNPNFGSRIPT